MPREIHQCQCEVCRTESDAAIMRQHREMISQAGNVHKSDSVPFCVGDSECVLVSKLAGKRVPQPLQCAWGSIHQGLRGCGHSNTHSIQIADLAGRDTGYFKCAFPGMAVMPLAF